MNIERKKLIRRLILKAVNRSSPYSVSESILFDEVEHATRPNILKDEMLEVLNSMEDFALIKRHRNDDEETMVKITSEGKAELR